jgi:hypothetical protein
MTDATLTERLAAIKAEIGAVGKDSRMTEGPAKYAYRGIDAILAAAHDSLIAHAVTIVPVDADATYQSRQSAKGNHMQWVSVKVRWEVRGAGETIPGASIGEALDSSDKATNKAHTAAHKVFLSELFAIPYSSDDPDHERPEAEPQAPPIPMPTEAQVTELVTRLEGYDRDEVKGWFKDKNWPPVAKMNKEQFDALTDWLDLTDEGEPF